MQSDSFKGCCSLSILHGFPHAGHHIVDMGQTQKQVREGLIKRLELSYDSGLAGVVISLTSKQYKTANTLKELGFDESPAAYKDISKVIAAQSDLVDVVHHLHQVLNVKG